MTTDTDPIEQVLIEGEGGVLRIRLNRPGKKNAITRAMYTAMTAALERAVTEPAVRVVLITGVPGCFTSGNDLLDFVQHPPKDESSPVLQFLGAMAAFPKPIVAAVNGIAVGIGVTLLLHCDLVYAAEDARFQMPFVNLGLCPEAASSYLLPRLMGHVRAAELLLLGEPFDARTAREFGLVNGLCSVQAVEEEAMARALRLAAQPPAAVRATKALIKSALVQPVAGALREESVRFAERLTSPEAAEAFQAFLGKRKPDFSRFE